MSSDRRPFSGLRVLDVTRVVASPFASYQLALLGAEVIKIEDPKHRGDAMRYRRGSRPELGEQGMATFYLAQAANKQSMTLDLRTPEGQRIFTELARGADVVIENLRAGTMDRYGLGYEALSTVNPRLVYCSVTGYGQTGPKRRHGAYDPVVQAASGLMSVNGTPDTAPVKVGAPMIDYGAGMAAAFGIASALYERERSQSGQYVDVSMLDSALVLMGVLATETATTGSKPAAYGNKAAVENYCNVCMPCKNGMIALSAMEASQRRRLWPAIGRPDIPLDPRFIDDSACRANVDALHAEMEATFRTRDAQHWEDVLNHANVPAMRVRTIPEALDMPQVRTRKLMHRLPEIPGVPGGATVPGLPFILSASEVRIDRMPPRLGEQTDTVLESLGYDTEAIRSLRERQVIG